MSLAGDMLTQAQGCTDRIAESADDRGELAALQRRNDAQCALALVQAAMTLQRGVTDARGRRP